MKAWFSNLTMRSLALAFAIAIAAHAETIRSISTFATGQAVNATGPDSITVGGGSIWVSYTNGADSTGLSGSSTVALNESPRLPRYAKGR